MKIPKSVDKLVSHFESLPGIGPKSAQRLAFYLLHVPQEYLDNFATSLSTLKQNTFICETCFNIGDSVACVICASDLRDPSVICVVEDALDVIALERSGKYRGRYHVLHGVIDPLSGIGPDDIYIPQLLNRIKHEDSEVEEVILATNPTMEGEATAMYILREIKSEKLKVKSENSSENEKLKINGNAKQLKITRIGHGLPVGADIEYADEITLTRAMESRREY